MAKTRHFSINSCTDVCWRHSLAKLPPRERDSQLSDDSDKANASSDSIKVVAIYEIIKGTAAMLGAGALWLWHKDLEQWLETATESWQQMFGKLLTPQIENVVEIAQQASKNWSMFMLLIFAYISLRFIEAYGLWQDKTWAYWFSVIGYGIFIPVELYYLINTPFDWFKLLILILNIIIVIVVYRNMRRKGLL
ncbi:DUF2127 domain-containing protein [Psychrobacter sp. F1192]|uniref:DUF2127 domain-containing protein n=1 Tax=Psychrobacter coccoides TaxID=2818440 RepID=A0ABS3NKX2_9GAMM|nr:DUF2127 domain-containing protein [Psychrobacter coccoides]